MKTSLSNLIFVLSSFVILGGAALAASTGEPVWPGAAPNESAQTTEAGDLTVPVWIYCPPAEKTSDACLIVAPGGGYNDLAVEHEGSSVAERFNKQGITVVILHYRIPRRENLPKHLPAWQDAQRTVRIVRSHAEGWGIDPEKIGMLGFSAGGHLTLMTATSSSASSYEPVDDLDRTVPCHLNFAVPIYPAYVLSDGANSVNKDRGYGATMVDDFLFDDKTPPICLIHGDDDPIASLGSIAVYEKVHQMEIPCELHILAGLGHGFGTRPSDDHAGDWPERVGAWMRAIGVY